MTLSFVMLLGILVLKRPFNDNVDVFKIFRFIRSIHFFQFQFQFTNATFTCRVILSAPDAGTKLLFHDHVVAMVHCVLSPQGLLHKYVMDQKENPCRLSGRTTVAWTGCIDTKVFHNQRRLDLEQLKMILLWGQENCGKRQ